MTEANILIRPMSKHKQIEYESLAYSNKIFLGKLEAAAIRVIRSGWYVLGQEVNAFEAEFARYHGARYCVGVGNGLDALTLALEALALPKASGVLVASNTYIATILAIVRAGHRPVLVEPDPETFNMDSARLARSMSADVRAICVTHMFGKPCRMEAITAFAHANDLRLVEDCAQSHGARLAGKITGTFGDAGCFSFYPTKNLGAIGDAGAIVTDDDELYDRILHLRNYGSKTKYINRFIGVNSRLDEIQAAMLRVKLEHLDSITVHKRKLAGAYFSGLPTWVRTPVCREDEFDVFHIFAIRYSERDKLRAFLKEHGVQTEIHYPIPPHRQEAMRGVLEGDYPIANELHATELSLPISYGHTIEDVHTVCDVFWEFGR